MNPERWRRIDDLFDGALRVAPAERESWLHESCNGDDNLRAELNRLLAHDERADRDGFLIPPELSHVDETGDWPPLRSRYAGAAGRPQALMAEFTDGFTPKAVIAPGAGPQTSDETRTVVRARLRELAVIYAVIFGTTLSLRPYILGHSEPILLALSGAVVVALMGVAAVLTGRRAFSLGALRAVELTMVLTIGGLVAFYQSWRLLSISAEDISWVGPLVIKNSVMLVSILILTYGIYVPKGWRRAAAVTVPLAFLPLMSLFDLYLRHPEMMDWLGRTRLRMTMPPLVSSLLDAVFLLVLAAVSSFGADTIFRLRRQVVEARQLGQYRLGRRIGTGGMGEVYLAEHQLLKRPCALKLIRPGEVVGTKALERFEREVRINATLSHPNTVDIYDYGRTEDGTYYYVMEYLPGMSLAELVSRHGPLPPGRAVYLLRQVCLALREAHSAGLIHRDVKPSNIYAARRGGMDDVAKLLDFGLVRPAATVGSPGLSTEGQILGTPLFMSPEQAMGGRDLDERSDIYSLGAVAYFLITGRPPFEDTGRGGIAVMIAHARDPVVPPSRVTAEVPDDLERVILRCLAKDPSQRYADAESLEQDLALCSAAGAWDQKQSSLWWRLHGETPEHNPGPRPATATSRT